MRAPSSGSATAGRMRGRADGRRQRWCRQPGSRRRAGPGQRPARPGTQISSYTLLTTGQPPTRAGLTLTTRQACMAIGVPPGQDRAVCQAELAGIAPVASHGPAPADGDPRHADHVAAPQPNTTAGLAGRTESALHSSHRAIVTSRNLRLRACGGRTSCRCVAAARQWWQDALVPGRVRGRRPVGAAGRRAS